MSPVQKSERVRGSLKNQQEVNALPASGLWSADVGQRGDAPQKDVKKTTIKPTMRMKTKKTWTQCPAKSRTFMFE
jgi:hypothetical protein